MKRVIIDYKNLTANILNLLVTKYPYGYEYDDIFTFQNSEGKIISVIEVNTVDTIYLIKISRELEEKIDNFMEDEDSFSDENPFSDENNFFNENDF